MPNRFRNKGLFLPSGVFLAALFCLLLQSAFSNTKTIPVNTGWIIHSGTLDEKLKFYRTLPTQSHEVTLLGMKVRKVDSTARAKYGMNKFDGVYISEIGKGWKEMGGKNLAVGSSIATVYDLEMRSGASAKFPVKVAVNILDKAKRQPGTEDLHSCVIITSKKIGSGAPNHTTDIVKFDPTHIAHLKKVLRPVTFFGVTFSYVSDSLSQLHNLEFTASIVVTKVTPEAKNHGLESLKVGYSITSVSVPGLAQGVFSPVDLAQVIIQKSKKNSTGDYEFTLSAYADAKPQGYKLRMSSQQLESLIRIVTGKG